jgi:predicted deacetylase
MSDWLDPVRRALVADVPAVTFFFRDDDAGWEDEQLYRLLDVMTRFHVPTALAAIPTAVGPRLAAELRALVTASARLVSVHQHGFAHVNHEANGRRSEFGAARPRAAQRDDLANGRQRLQHALGMPLPPIFTPPWNRCGPDTCECLVELGYEVLSRDVTAEPAGMTRLHELPICLDWSGRRGARLGAASWGRTIARAIVPGATVGVMLHHAVMSADDRRMLAELVQLLVESPHPVRQMLAIATRREAAQWAGLYGLPGAP